MPLPRHFFLAGEAPWATVLHSIDSLNEEAVADGQFPLVFLAEKRATTPRFKAVLAALHAAGTS